MCPYCQNKYIDPRLVECCSSFCMPCIELLMDPAETGFKCPVCRDFHEKPPNGYLKNSNLAKICEKKASPISRGASAAMLKTQLDELKPKLDELIAEERLGTDEIEKPLRSIEKRNAARLRGSHRGHQKLYFREYRVY